MKKKAKPQIHAKALEKAAAAPKPLEKSQEEKVIDTTRQAVPFDTANSPGPKMARAVMPAVSGKMIAKAKRPLLIVGSRIHEPDILSRAIALGRSGIQIAAV